MSGAGRTDTRPLGLGPAGPGQGGVRVEPVGQPPGLRGERAVAECLESVEAGRVAGQPLVDGGPVLTGEAGGLPDQQRGPPLRDPTGGERGQRVGHLVDQRLRESEVPAAGDRGLPAGQRHLGGHPTTLLAGRQPQVRGGVVVPRRPGRPPPAPAPRPRRPSAAPAPGAARPAPHPTPNGPGDPAPPPSPRPPGSRSRCRTWCRTCVRFYPSRPTVSAGSADLWTSADGEVSTGSTTGSLLDHRWTGSTTDWLGLEGCGRPRWLRGLDGLDHRWTGLTRPGWTPAAYHAYPERCAGVCWSLRRSSLSLAISSPDGDPRGTRTVGTHTRVVKPGFSRVRTTPHPPKDPFPYDDHPQLSRTRRRSRSTTSGPKRTSSPPSTRPSSTSTTATSSRAPS